MGIKKGQSDVGIKATPKEREILDMVQSCETRAKSLSANFNALITVSALPVEKIAAAKNSIDVFDTNSITTYGVRAQKAVNSVSDNILAGVKAKDVGPVADSLNAIVANIRGLDVAALDKKPGFLSKLFKAASPVVNFIASYESATHQIDAIVNNLDRQRSQLSRSVANLDILYRETEKSAVELEIFITALREKMDEFERDVLPSLKARAEESATPMSSQEYGDAKAIYDRLDRKYSNLRLTRQVALQNLPSIRLTQDHDVSLIEKVNEIEVNVLPLWKRQLAIALESSKTSGAGRAADAVVDLTNSMLVAGAKQLGQAQIEAQKSIERGIIDVSAVTKANDILIETINTTQTMIEDGRNKRKEAEEALTTAETALLKAITSH